MAGNPADAGKNGPVVGKGAVAVQLDEALDDAIDIAARRGAVHVAGDLHALPCAAGRSLQTHPGLAGLAPGMALQLAAARLLGLLGAFRPPDKLAHHRHSSQAAPQPGGFLVANALAHRLGLRGHIHQAVGARADAQGVHDAVVGDDAPHIVGGRVQREQLRQNAAHLGALDNGVDEPVLKRELGGLEPFRQLLLDGVADDALPGKPDERAGFGQNDVALHGERRRHAAGRGVGEHGDEGQTGRAQALHGAGHLRHLHQRDEPLLHAGAPGRTEHDDRQALGNGAVDHRGHFLAHRMPHRAHEEAGLHDADGQRQAGDGRAPRAHGLFKPALCALVGDFLGIAGEIERIEIGHDRVPLLERPGVHRGGQALVGAQALQGAAGRAIAAELDDLLFVEEELAVVAAAPMGRPLIVVGKRRRCRRRLPGRLGGLRRAGGGQKLHPTGTQGALRRRSEHAQAAFGGVAQEIGVLGERRLGAVEEDERGAASLGRREHRVDVGGKRVGVHIGRGAAQVVRGQHAPSEAVQRAVVHRGEDDVEARLLHGHHEGPGVLGRGDDEGPGLGPGRRTYGEVVADGGPDVLGDVGHLLLRVAMGRPGTGAHQGRRRVRQGAGRFHDGVQGVGDRRFQRAVLGRLGGRRAIRKLGDEVPRRVEADVLGSRFGHSYSLGASTYFWVAVAQTSPSTDASTSATTRRRDDFTMVARNVTVSPGAT